MKKILSVVLAAAICLSTVPLAAFAKEADTGLTVDGNNLYANGNSIILEEADDGTAIYIDKDADGKADEKELVTDLTIGEDNDGTDGYDLSDVTVFGGSKDVITDKTASIIVNGGSVKAIYAGGSALLTGDVCAQFESIEGIVDATLANLVAQLTTLDASKKAMLETVIANIKKLQDEFTTDLSELGTDFDKMVELANQFVKDVNEIVAGYIIPESEQYVGDTAAKVLENFKVAVANIVTEFTANVTAAVANFQAKSMADALFIIFGVKDMDADKLNTFLEIAQKLEGYDDLPWYEQWALKGELVLKYGQDMFDIVFGIISSGNLSNVLDWAKFATEITVPVTKLVANISTDPANAVKEFIADVKAIEVSDEIKADVEAIAYKIADNMKEEMEALAVSTIASVKTNICTAIDTTIVDLGKTDDKIKEIIITALAKLDLNSTDKDIQKILESVCETLKDTAVKEEMVANIVAAAKAYLCDKHATVEGLIATIVKAVKDELMVVVANILDIKADFIAVSDITVNGGYVENIYARGVCAGIFVKVVNIAYYKECVGEVDARELDFDGSKVDLSDVKLPKPIKDCLQAHLNKIYVDINTVNVTILEKEVVDTTPTPTPTPSTAPTTEPSTAPTTEPSTAPTTEPSTDPEVTATPAPTVAPTEEPDVPATGDSSTAPLVIGIMMTSLVAIAFVGKKRFSK